MQNTALNPIAQAQVAPLLVPDGGLATAPAADLAGVFERQLAAHRRLFADLDRLAEGIAAAAECMAQCLAGGGRLFFFGNGGSACDSLHIAAELTGRLKTDRQ